MSKQQSFYKSYSEQYSYKKRSDKLYSEQSNYKKGPAYSYSEENYYKKVPDDSYSENIFSSLKKYELKSVDGKCYLCSPCKVALLMNRMPAMSVANGLQLNNAPDRPDLTELENNLIAHNINFQKIVLLQKSRWPAGKGRMVSVPVGPDDIMNTVKQLPRLPSEAGLIPIKLKRMQKYKGHEKKEMIRPEKIFQALQSLRHHGHPFYQFYDSKENYMARCRERDERGFRLLMGEDDEDCVEDLEVEQMPIDQPDVEDEAVKERTDDDLEDEMDKEERDIQDDPVRRQHFNYTEYSCLVNGHPEIFLNSKGNQVTHFFGKLF